MRYILGIILISLLLVACNDTKGLEKEIKYLKSENAELKKQSIDSVSIYHAITENRDQQFAEKFVDSLSRANPRLYEKIDNEMMLLKWNSNIEYTE